MNTKNFCIYVDEETYLNVRYFLSPLELSLLSDSREGIFRVGEVAKNNGTTNSSVYQHFRNLKSKMNRYQKTGKIVPTAGSKMDIARNNLFSEYACSIFTENQMNVIKDCLHFNAKEVKMTKERVAAKHGMAVTNVNYLVIKFKEARDDYFFHHDMSEFQFENDKGLYCDDKLTLTYTNLNEHALEGLTPFERTVIACEENGYGKIASTNGITVREVKDIFDKYNQIRKELLCTLDNKAKEKRKKWFDFASKYVNGVVVTKYEHDIINEMLSSSELKLLLIEENFSFRNGDVLTSTDADILKRRVLLKEKIETFRDGQDLVPADDSLFQVKRNKEYFGSISKYLSDIEKYIIKKSFYFDKNNILTVQEISADLEIGPSLVSNVVKRFIMGRDEFSSLSKETKMRGIVNLSFKGIRGKSSFYVIAPTDMQKLLCHAIVYAEKEHKGDEVTINDELRSIGVKKIATLKLDGNYSIESEKVFGLIEKLFDDGAVEKDSLYQLADDTSRSNKLYRKPSSLTHEEFSDIYNYMYNTVGKRKIGKTEECLDSFGVSSYNAGNNWNVKNYNGPRVKENGKRALTKLKEINNSK